jgi:hypothetical protein
MKWTAIGLVITLAACKSEVSFAFYADSSRGLTTDLVHVRFSDGLLQRTLDGRHFRTSAQSGVPRTENFGTQDHGTLHAVVWLVSAGDTIAVGSVQFPLRDDWRWGVDIFVADSNPMKYCFGCFGSRSFKAAPGAPGDSLFLVWGGNSISHPVVY